MEDSKTGEIRSRRMRTGGRGEGRGGESQNEKEQKNGTTLSSLSPFSTSFLSLLQPVLFTSSESPTLSPSIISNHVAGFLTLLGFPPSILTTFVLNCSQSGSFGRFCAILGRVRFDIGQLDRRGDLAVVVLESRWRRRKDDRIHMLPMRQVV